MKPQAVYYSPEFKKMWQKVPKEVQKKAIKKEKIFRENIFQHQLKTHKLKGILNGYYSFSVDYHFRIVFELQGSKVFFLAIGTHEVYR